MINLTIITNQQTYHKAYQMPVRLSTAIKECGLHFPMPCGGRGTCGKCRVSAEGKLTEMGSTEFSMLSPDERNGGVRLACMAWAEGDAVVHLPESSAPVQGITNGESAPFIRQPLTGGAPCFAAAVDIGTTTIAGYLYQMPDCKLIRSVCVENKQTAFGADVLSRISYANAGGLDELTELVRRQIGELFAEPVEKWIITGNTTMLHLLAGVNPTGIATAPFTPASLFGKWLGSAYLPRCISAYVGADITTAVTASGMTEHTAAFLVDIGTNGEMALWHNGVLTCCSTAAGPAFEGAGIEHGMPAAPGAICKVSVENGRLTYQTLDNAPPAGICGSGLLDAAACLLRLGIIDQTGYMEEPYPIADSGVYITPNDVRQLQLAKAAVRAGIDTLISHCKINPTDLERFYIAGGFGSSINVQSAAEIGMVPQWTVPIAKAIGNGAGTGAAMLLQSEPLLDKTELLAKNARTVELSTNAEFMDAYIRHMQFQR